MNFIFKFLFLFFFIILYVFSVNVVADFDMYLTSYQNSKSNLGSLTIGVNEQVTVTAEKDRFYGTIYQQGGDQDLQLFNLVPLPLVRDTTSYVLYHWAFGGILTLLMLLMFLKGGKKYNEDIYNFGDDSFSDSWGSDYDSLDS